MCFSISLFGEAISVSKLERIAWFSCLDEPRTDFGFRREIVKRMSEESCCARIVEENKIRKFLRTSNRIGHNFTDLLLGCYWFSVVQ